MDAKRKLQLFGTFAAVSIVLFARRRYLKSKRKHAYRKEWTRKRIKRRSEGGGVLNMLNEELLVEDPAAYQNFLRINNVLFEELLIKVTPLIEKQNTKFRESVSARNRLQTTIRFLATGETYRSLMYSTRIHETTISKFIPEVCHGIYSVLKDEHLSAPTTATEWLVIAKGFEEARQFPNYVGTLYGRHIKFRPPISAGSYYYNYKGDHSIVLLGLIDSAYRFIYYNVGVNGRVSDGGVFQQ